MIVRGPVLNPRPDGSVEFIADAVLASDDAGRIRYFGAADRIDCSGAEPARGVICPPFFDNHIHIPQHPIRGRFMEGIGATPPEGRLLAGLNRNVFPAEARCSDEHYTRQIVREFLDDTLSHGVIGGAAYMSVHTPAAGIALEMLPATWSVGPVLMNQNCPQYLRTDEPTWQRDVESLASRFGQRVIVTDRFAVSVDSRLRREAVALAKRLGLRMQTHLNEQFAEKRFVEATLYPHCTSYTDVYAQDGLLDCRPILAHCVRMSTEEFETVGSRPAAAIAHCPTSNTLLGSGVMPLDRLFEYGIDYAICTDVGASPTTSMLCEMAQFLKVHFGASRHATPREALYRATLAPAKMLSLDCDFGSFDAGKSMTFIEIACNVNGIEGLEVDELIQRRILEMAPPAADQVDALSRLRRHGLDAGEELELLRRDVDATVARLEQKVRRVIVDARTVWQDFR